MSNLKVELNVRTDSNGKKFYIGKLEYPGTIECHDGVTFLIFVADSGAEELQISVMDKDKFDKKPQKPKPRQPEIEYIK
jgi:hypothetical protein